MTTISRRRAVAHEALVVDPARGTLRVCAAERPAAEQAGERAHQEQRDDDPADALDPPFGPMKLQLRVELFFNRHPPHVHVLQIARRVHWPTTTGDAASRGISPACATVCCAGLGQETTVKIETISVRVGRDIEPATGEVAPAVHLSTTYERDIDGEFSRGYSYIRPDNPSRRALEQCIAALEGGADATAYSSGLRRVARSVQPAAPRRSRDRADRGLSRHRQAAARHRRPDGRELLVRRHDEQRSRAPGAHRQDAAGVDRDAVEPDAQHQRHRDDRGARARPRRARLRATTRSRRRCGRSRSSSAPTW